MTDGYINKRTLKQELALAINDYKLREKIQMIVDGIAEINTSERDIGKEPILESRTSTYHVSYADGSGGFESKTFEDWVCPTCGWFVGELYCGYGKWHIQGEKTYCASCGQKIDWSLPKEEEKRRYEERCRIEREEWYKKNGIPLDNMNERKRAKYGMLAEIEE